MSLIAAEIEKRGIATSCVILLREIAEKVRPPRALCVPFPFGYPLGKPHDAELQRAVVRAALELLESEGPVITDFWECGGNASAFDSCRSRLKT